METENNNRKQQLVKCKLGKMNETQMANRNLCYTGKFILQNIDITLKMTLTI